MTEFANGSMPRVGVFEIMPKPAAALEHFRPLETAAAEPIEIVPLRFVEDPRRGSDVWDEIQDFEPATPDILNSLDGAVITGANVERNPDGSLRRLDDVEFSGHLSLATKYLLESERLKALWAGCWGGHWLLGELLDEDNRQIVDGKKLIDTIADDYVDTESPIMRGISRPIIQHGRWASVSEGALAPLAKNGLKVVSAHRGYRFPGWSVATMSLPKRGKIILSQGHPEYFPDTALKEREREEEDGNPVHEAVGTNLVAADTCTTRSLMLRNYGNMVLANAA